ncbi:MAG: hypothetical protein C4320_04175 [Armatimonadota bacterium]
MKRWILRWLLMAVSFVVASYVTQAIGLGGFTVAHDAGGFLKLMIGVIAFSLLNATLGAVLRLLTLPLSCLTLGAFSLVVNALVFMVAGQLDLGFRVDATAMGFVAALVASLLVSFINGMLGVFLPDGKHEPR